MLTDLLIGSSVR